MKVRLRLIVVTGLICLVAGLVLVPGFFSVSGINGFSPNQELPLPLTPGNLPVQFIVRGLEPGIRVDQQGTVYVDSIRGVPTGFDLHRWSPVVDPPANADGTYPFQYLGPPDDPNAGAGQDTFNISVTGPNFSHTVKEAPSPAATSNSTRSNSEFVLRFFLSGRNALVPRPRRTVGPL